jgi:hypothetical protein
VPDHITKCRQCNRDLLKSNLDNHILIYHSRVDELSNKIQGPQDERNEMDVDAVLEDSTVQAEQLQADEGKIFEVSNIEELPIEGIVVAKAAPTKVFNFGARFFDEFPLGLPEVPQGLPEVPQGLPEVPDCNDEMMAVQRELARLQGLLAAMQRGQAN